MSFTSIDYIVRNFLIEKGEESTHKYQRALQLAVRGVKELSFMIPHYIKTVKLTKSANGTLDWPQDYLDYLKLGVVRDGRLYTLSVNTNMHKLRDTDTCGNLTDFNKGYRNDYLPTNGYWFVNYIYGGIPQSLFGHGGGINYKGYFTIDREYQRFSFDNTVIDEEFYLEYQSNGMRPDGESLVPEQAVEAIIEWVHWRDQKGKGNNLGKEFQSKQDFGKAKEGLIMKVNGFTIQDFISMTNRHFMPAPKGF